MGQPPPSPRSGASPYEQPGNTSGPNTIQVVLVAVTVMLLVGVLVYFLFLGDTDGGTGSGSPTTPVSTTAAPSTVVVAAPCVTAEINEMTQGRRDEVALYQQTLKDLGYDPGDVDGYFGPRSFDAAWQEIVDNGNVVDADGVFEEAFLDDRAVLLPAFERLGISC